MSDKNTGLKLIALASVSVSLVGPAGEATADPEEYAYDDYSNDNALSAPTVDATSKTEYLSSTTVYVNGTKKVRVSQAFVLQTATNKYKTLPMA